MAKNRAEIRGVIVSSDYDIQAFFPYIKRGVITPESYLRNQIEKFSPASDAEIYINSSGGSVFAGNEMINAIREWQEQTGRKIIIKVGSLAASMAANMIAVLGNGENVQVHDNTKIMYHGAWGMQVGGSDAMKDYSELLSQINADVKIKLISKFGIAEETVNEWFAEGREGWITSKQAVEFGLASNIIGDTAESVESPNNIQEFLTERGEKLAAQLIINNATKEEKTMKQVWDKALAMVGLGADSKEEDVLSALDNLPKAESLEEVKAELEDVKGQLEIAVQKSVGHESTIQALESEKVEMSTKIETIEAEKAEVSNELATAKSKLSALNRPLKKDDSKEAFGSFKEAVKKLGYVDAKQQYKELYDQYMKENAKEV